MSDACVQQVKAGRVVGDLVVQVLDCESKVQGSILGTGWGNEVSPTCRDLFLF